MTVVHLFAELLQHCLILRTDRRLSASVKDLTEIRQWRTLFYGDHRDKDVCQDNRQSSFLLMAFVKNERIDLTKEQLRLLSKAVKEELK